MTVLRVVGIVTAVALFGMLLGAAFGWGAATIAPTFFMTVVPWKDVEPVGVATVLGAFGGVLCGGALGVFSLLIEAFSGSRSRGKEM